MEQPVDSKAYYGYLFEDNKKPTKILDALLRGIANYIVRHLLKLLGACYGIR
jgi:hypothetical protein